MSAYWSWEPWVGFAMALAAIAMGVLFRLGRLRRQALWYSDRTAPWYLRHLPFGLIPAGLMMAFMLGAVGFLEQPRARSTRLGWIMLAIGGAFFALFVLMLFRPPRWAKPRWIRDGDIAAEPEGAARDAGRTWRALDNLVFAAALALAVATTMVFVALAFVS